MDHADEAGLMSRLEDISLGYPGENFEFYQKCLVIDLL